MCKLVNDWPARWAATDPDRVAVRDAARNVALTWGALDRQAAAVAAFLGREAHVGPGDRVAVLAESRVETVVAFFAVARLRAVLVPLNAKLAAAELARVFVDAAPRAFLVSAQQAAAAPGLLAALAGAGPARQAPVVVGLDGDLPGAATAWSAVLEGGHEGAPREAVVDEADPWLVLYTSGSTGRPKGALVTHRQIVWNALQTHIACDLGPGDATVTYTPLFYTGGWNVLSTPLWHRGATVHLLPAFDAEGLLALVARERITVLFGVPTTLAAMAASPSFARTDLSSIRVLLAGGAACPPALLAAYAERGLILRPGYGLTEVGPNSFGLRPEEVARKAGSIGRPNLHLEARVTRDDGRDVEPGAPGELRLRGPTVFGGYLDDPASTSAAFDADGFLRTGDIVRVDEDGFFWLVGRKNEMFKSGGEKVYAGEVEAAIAAHEGVAEVVVFGVPEAKWGEVGRAVVVPRPGAAIDAATLRGWLDGRLARFKAPKSFVFTDALPRTETGKVARAAVRARFA